MTRILTPLIAGTAILGASQALAQSDSAQAGSTQPGAMASYCENAFYPADTDQSGTLSQDELSALNDAAYKALDTNEDGSIDREEYVNCTARAQSASAGTQGTPSQQMMDETWSRLDTNADNEVSADEFASAATAATREAMSGEANQSPQQTGDAGSGEVNWFHQYMYGKEADLSALRNRTAEEFDAESAGRFAQVDVDNNGRISSEEWTAAAADRSFDIETVAGEAFADMDSDGDGTVTKQEFVAKSEEGVNRARDAAESAGMDSVVTEVPVIYYYIYAM